MSGLQQGDFLFRILPLGAQRKRARLSYSFEVLRP
jgi:hypothetical protein